MSAMPVTYQERIAMPMGPVARPGGAGDVGMTVKDIISAIRQRIFLVIFVWFFCIGVTVAGTLVWLRFAPRYVAAARVYVESPKPQMPFTMEQREQVSTQEMVNRMLLDQAVVAKSDDVLMEALRDSNVMNTQWYKSYTEANKPQMLKDLGDELAVAPVQGTAFLQIAIGTKSIEDPHVIVNTVVKKYIRQADNLSRVRYSEQVEEYKNQRRRLQDQLDQLRKQKEQFVMQQLATPGATLGLNFVGEALSRVVQEATLMEAEQTRYKTLFESMRNASAQQISISPQMQMMIENDPRVSSLNGFLSSLESNRLVAVSTFGKNHPTTKEIDNQIAAVREMLDRELAIKQDQVRQFEQNQAEMNYLSATEALLQLRERQTELEYRQRDLDRQLAQYRSIEEEIEQVRLNLDQVDQYLRMLEMIVQQSSVIRVHEMGQAIRPIDRSSPRWTLNVPVGTFMGLVLAVGLAVLLEFADVSVRTPRDINRHVRVPILGTVPDTDDEEVAIDRVELAVHTSPRSMLAEAFRSIRTNLLLSAPAERLRTIVVTSPKPEDGKTAIATNLSLSIAQSGRRVLLVDANFRRPTLHKIFPSDAKLGFCNALIGQARIDELVRKTSLPNLDVVYTGPIPPNPAELMGGALMREFLAQATERYDHVIFDAPPVLLVSDALVLAGVVDGAVLVCRAKANSRGVVQRARDLLERVHAHLYGAVLNAAQATRGGYFREQLRSFYDYQAEELPAGELTAALPNETPAGSSSDKNT